MLFGESPLISLPIGSVRDCQLSHEFPHMRRDTHCNVIGPVVQRLRKQRGWSQAKLAEHLQSAGWKISRSGLARSNAGLSGSATSSCSTS